jgi:hypothetical protein
MGLNQGQTQQNLFADPGDTEVVLFEATSRLTGFQGNQIWMGATGVSKDWGSCNVLASADGTTYKQIGTIDTIARLGVLDSTFASGSDPDTSNALVVDLVANSAMLDAGATADADNANTLCYVDGELLSYSAAAISGPDQYTLDTYIRRGQFGSSIGSHAAGSSFLRLDDSVFKFTYDTAWGGRTVYFKFQSVNTFGNSAQDVSTLTPLAFTIPGLNPGLPPMLTTNVINPDFEIGTDLPPYGWLLSPGASVASIAYDTSTPYAGARSLKVSALVGGVQFINGQKFVVRPGDSYQISAALNLPLGSGGSAVQAIFSWRDGSGASISGGASDLVASQTSVGGGWSVITASGAAPAGAVSGQIQLALVVPAHTIGEWDSIELIRMPNLSSDVVGVLPTANLPARASAISYVIDGNGSVVSTGGKGQVSVPSACTVTGWVITGDASGSAVVDVLRSTYAAFPTTASIAGTDKPTLSSAQKNENTGPLSGWGSTVLNAGDIVQFNVNSCSTCKLLIVTLNLSIPA